MDEISHAKSKTDRFGWLSGCSKAELDIENYEIRKEKEREAKWIKMINRWGYFSTRKTKTLNRRVMKGIPDSIRARVWKLVIDPDFQIATERPAIQLLVNRGRKTCCDAIDLDISRTLPHVVVFNGQLHDSLQRILHAYSNVDEEVGYTQGMAFIAGLLLLYMDETGAYWCFEKLMTAPRYNLRQMFLSGFPRLNEMNKVWDVMLNDRFPEIFKKFQEYGICAVLYTTPWWLSCFINVPIPAALLLRLFDRYIFFGTRALFSFGLAIVGSEQASLLKVDVEDAVILLQKPEQSTLVKDWVLLLNNFDKHWINPKQFSWYQEKAGVKQFY